MTKKQEPILEKLSGEVTAVLKLLNPDTAEQIIGSDPPEEYRTLIQGTRAVHTMMWSVLKQHGLTESQDALKAGAQALMMLLQIVNYAYALGLKRGREGN